MRQQPRRTASLQNLPEARLEQLARRIAARHVPLSAIQSVSMLIAALAAGTAQAATYIVDTTLDGPTGQVEGCSLREAITSLSVLTDIGDCTHTGAFGVADTVDLSMLGGTIRLDREEGEIAIAVPLSITGPALGSKGQPTLTIKGNKGKEPSRIFIMFPSSATNISNLKLSGGQTVANNQGGGAIFSASDVTLTNSVVTGSSTLGNASAGGGLFVSGNTTLINSTVSKNKTSGGSSDGGGLYAGNGNVTLTNSTVTRNRCEGEDSEGGGMRVIGDATLTDSIVSRNQTRGPSSRGGGSIVLGNVTLTNSTVTRNQTRGNYSYGGGMLVSGSITLTGSTVSDNKTSGNFSGGGGLSVTGPTVLTDSTVSGNRTAGDSSLGGGLYIFGNTTLTNSTVSGNRTTGGASAGGGMYILNADATLSNSTIAFNLSSSGADGVYINAGDTFTADNSIIAQNGTGDAACSATIDAGGDNLVASTEGGDASCGSTSAILTQVTSKDLNLLPLADNGGDTRTHALEEGSSALDAGDNGTCESTDQRGVSRPQNGTCDIGSFELEGS